MSDRQLNPTAKALFAAKRSIESPENWWSGFDSDLQPHQHCALTALGQETSKDDRAFRALYQAAEDLFGETTPWKVNDYHGHAAVMQMYDYAINLAMKEKAR
jgi:hypothetical protein